MLIFNIVIFAIWMLVGAITLIPKHNDVTKYEYALVWIVLMVQLLKNILCDA